MESYGPPIAYSALAPGTSVYDASGADVGTVEHVLADEEVDIFDGLIIEASALPGGHRFADAEQIEGLYEQAVLLSVDADALHEPSENPAAMGSGPDDTAEGELERRLRRAWDWISGNY